QILNRLVPFGNINPAEATSIFIRAALVERPGDLPPLAPHHFLAHNRRLQEKIESWQTRARSTALPNVEEALYRFYSKQIKNVSSLPDLNRFIKEQSGGNPTFLCATENDLTGGPAL